MEIETRAFGSIEIDDHQIITLTEPMPGFPDDLRFVVLDPPDEVPFQWFQSVDRDDVCFLVADPRRFFPDYRLELRETQLRDLEIDHEEQTAVAVILNIPEDPAEATANLLGPLVFNTVKKLGRQVILEGSGNAVRAPLFSSEEPKRHVG